MKSSLQGGLEQSVFCPYLVMYKYKPKVNTGNLFDSRSQRFSEILDFTELFQFKGAIRIPLQTTLIFLNCSNGSI
jgi:hypothetical protein